MLIAVYYPPLGPSADREIPVATLLNLAESICLRGFGELSFSELTRANNEINLYFGCTSIWWPRGLLILFRGQHFTVLGTKAVLPSTVDTSKTN